MYKIRACCVCEPTGRFQATMIERRALGPRDVLIDIAFCGVCHTDIHYVRDEFGRTTYPIVPGHEIAGIVAEVGAEVTKFRPGDRAGVGCFVDACLACESCRAGLEQYCSGLRVTTYNSKGRDGLITQGGYSERIVVDERFVIRIPDAITLQAAAPLFCAGITMYSPLRRWKAGPGRRVAIIGFGGLGHVGVQIARAMGAHTTVVDLAPSKRDDAIRLGADDFRCASAPDELAGLASSFDLIVSTVPVSTNIDAQLEMLRVDGTLVTIGVPEKPLSIAPFSLLRNRRSIAGTLSGGIAETQEMIDFCAAHGVGAEVEVISAERIDEAFDRVLKGDVRYRFVIDAGSFARP